MLRGDSKNCEIFITTPYCFYYPPIPTMPWTFLERESVCNSRENGARARIANRSATVNSLRIVNLLRAVFLVRRGPLGTPPRQKIAYATLVVNFVRRRPFRPGRKREQNERERRVEKERKRMTKSCPPRRPRPPPPAPFPSDPRGIWSPNEKGKLKKSIGRKE